MKKRCKFIYLFTFLILLFSVQVSAYYNPVKNVILMIGDGMGIEQVTAARVASQGADGLLNLDELKYTGFLKTHSANNLVTDSAAAGTALATGVKTNNNYVALDPERRKLKSLLILAKEMGKKVGLVTTTRLTDATPAAFGAHNISRKNEKEIAADLINKDIDLLMGGGLDIFGTDPFTRKPKSGSLIRQAEEYGYTFIDTAEKLKNVTDAQKLLGIFNFGDLNFINDRFPPFEPSLPEMSASALEYLSNDNGFFLMIEGGRIDDASHLNDPEKTINETIEFDQAVGVVLDFAKKSKDTLVIITADHQTGGFALNRGLLNGENLSIGWTTGDHTGCMVPIYAYGPGAQNVLGTHHLIDISRLMADQLGIEKYPQYYKEK
ncbi:MAG: alkaline phosphatase [Halanaerobiales bacterium]|nr:alkaline phosphatase [Halanaerobiales bacterium]